MKIQEEVVVNKNTRKHSSGLEHIEKMHDYVAGRAHSAAVYVAAKLGISDHLINGPRSCEELANTLHVAKEPLYRLMRALSSLDIYKELEDGTFTLTPLAETMLSDSDNSLRHLIIMCGSPWHWQVWGGLLYSIETGEPYFVKHFGMDFFPYIKSHPDVASEFNAAMTSLSSITDIAIAEKYDFSEHKCVVDVGGGKGGLIQSILKRNPKLNGILYDLPNVVKNMPRNIEKEVLDRLKVMDGDFFTSIPTGGDVYVIKHVLHGLNTQQSVDILKNIKNVLTPDGKVLIAEMIMPEKNNPAFSKFNDLGMMLLSATGCERTLPQFEEIIDASGFKLSKVIPIQMGVYLIEAVISIK